MEKVNVTRSKKCKVSPDRESEDFKVVTVSVTFKDASVEDLLEAVLKSEIIRWQQGARKKYDSIVDKSTVHITFKAPVRSEVSPEEAMAILERLGYKVTKEGKDV